MNQFLSYKHIENWFKAIEEGTIKVCKEQLLLKKYLEERVFTREDIYFDKQMVDDSINIPAQYFPFELIPWEKFLQCFIYGVRWKKDKTLVFNRYLTLMGRGNGKTGYASWNNFFLLTAKHGIKNYNIDIFANNEDQAKTSFEDVYQVIKAHPDLDKKYLKQPRKSLKILLQIANFVITRRTLEQKMVNDQEQTALMKFTKMKIIQ